MTRSRPAVALSSRPPGRRPGGALYKLIAAQIEQDIAAGKFAVGTLLPTEAEFGQMLNVGRHTVRDALRLLSQAGLITRRAGSGSTVVSNGRRHVFAHSITNFDQWFNYPQTVKRRHIDHEHVVADQALAQALGCEIGTAWFRISALRTYDQTLAPLCWVDIYVQPRFASVIRSKQLDAYPIHEQLESMFGVAIAEVEVQISASRVPSRMARSLAVEADSPALLLQRRYLASSGELLQASRTIHPENLYVYAMKFRRTSASKYD
jgi:GntR family transcriptional regulator